MRSRRLRPFVSAAFATALLAESAGLPGAPAALSAQATTASSGAQALADDLAANGLADAGVPGLVVILVKDGQVVLAKAYGLADIERRVPMTVHTNLRAGSVSKPVTAVAVMKLVEEGRLALGAPIDRYLPDLVRPDAYGPPSTVAQLMTMTGGYTDDVLKVHAPTMAEFIPLGDFVRRRLAPREVRPGVMVYSSWNLALVGVAMERVTGKPFDQVLKDTLFDPLGMSSSSFSQPLPQSLASNLATGYFRDGGRLQIVPDDLVPLSPGIALVTTAEDMGRFMAALLPAADAQGPAILGPEALRGLLTRQAGVHPLLRGRSYGFSESPFGPPGTLYHDGNGIGFSSRMILVPSERIGIFVSVNHRPLDRGLDQTPAFGFAKNVAVKLLERVAPGEPARRPLMKALPTAPGSLQRYTGQYQAASAPRHNLMKLGMLFDYAVVRANGDGSLSIGAHRYMEVESGVFQNQKYPDTLAVFTDDGADRIRYLSFGGTGAYERVPWYGEIGVQAALCLALGLVSLAHAVVWPLRRKGPALGWVLSLLNLGFFAGWALLMTFDDLLLLFKTIHAPLLAVLALPWIGAAAGMVLLVRGRTWSRHAEGKLWDRWCPRLVALASLGIVAVAASWRLYPW